MVCPYLILCFPLRQSKDLQLDIIPATAPGSDIKLRDAAHELNEEKRKSARRKEYVTPLWLLFKQQCVKCETSVAFFMYTLITCFKESYLVSVYRDSDKCWCSFKCLTKLHIRRADVSLYISTLFSLTRGCREMNRWTEHLFRRQLLTAVLVQIN